MPLYWIFILIAIVAALRAGCIDPAVQAKGRLKKWAVGVCVVFVVGITVLIKTAL